MKTEEVIEYFEIFKKQYESQKLEVSFEEFDKYFYVETYFMNRTVPYFEKNFNVLILQIIGESLKYMLSDLEYYVSLRPSGPLSSSDFEVLEKNKDILKIYYRLHILFKKSNLFYMKHEENSSEIVDFFSEVVEDVKEFYKVNQEILPKLIENLEKKFLEIGNDKKVEVESSIFH